MQNYWELSSLNNPIRIIIIILQLSCFAIYLISFVADSWQILGELATTELAHVTAFQVARNCQVRTTRARHQINNYAFI
jgi:hypothetical protein